MKINKIKQNKSKNFNIHNKIKTTTKEQGQG